VVVGRSLGRVDGEHREGKRMRRVYTATAKGRKALEAAKGKVRELFGELLEES
jgi:DNA-binding PadR family transcriptional regulator